jgi:hypothetical protein
MAFNELTKSWIGKISRLNLYSEAYPDTGRMSELIEDVYLGVGELAVESQRYYLRKPYSKL